jgi:hypothetical protein
VSLLPGMTELSYCGGYYHPELVRSADGWRSRSLAGRQRLVH